MGAVRKAELISLLCFQKVNTSSSWVPKCCCSKRLQFTAKCWQHQPLGSKGSAMMTQSKPSSCRTGPFCPKMLLLMLCPGHPIVSYPPLTVGLLGEDEMSLPRNAGRLGCSVGMLKASLGANNTSPVCTYRVTLFNEWHVRKKQIPGTKIHLSDTMGLTQQQLQCDPPLSFPRHLTLLSPGAAEKDPRYKPGRKKKKKKPFIK